MLKLKAFDETSKTLFTNEKWSKIKFYF